MEWIKCSDRLPVEGEPVLVIWQWHTQQITFIYDEGDWYGYDPFGDEYRGEKVTDDFLTHWMPLPEPPK